MSLGPFGPPPAKRGPAPSQHQAIWRRGYFLF